MNLSTFCHMTKLGAFVRSNNISCEKYMAEW